MGGITDLIGSLTGGLLGGPDVPKAKEAREQAAGTDPGRGAELAEARKRAAAAKASQGRPNFRVDLNSGAETARGGLRIQ